MRGVALSLVLCLSVWGSAGGEIYRWTDASGKLHFSDRPPHMQTEKADLFLNDGIPPLPLRTHGTNMTALPRAREEKPKKVRAEDYEINFSASQRGDELTVSGRIGNGPECSSLKVAVSLQDEGGTRKSVTGMVGNVGYGRSDLLHARTKVAATPSRNAWTITDIEVACRR